MHSDCIVPRYQPGFRLQFNCVGCGCMFELRPCDAQGRANKFCSRTCFLGYRHGPNHPDWDRVERKCAQCGRDFFIPQAYVRRGKRQYCGNTCRGLAMRQRHAVTCPQCGTTVPKKRPDQKFCSALCGHLSQRKPLSGDAPEIPSQPKPQKLAKSKLGRIATPKPAKVVKPQPHRVVKAKKTYQCAHCRREIAARNKYCGPTCRRAAALRGADHFLWKGGNISRSCDQCGQMFAAVRAAVNNGLARFCTQKCYIRWVKEQRESTFYKRIRAGKRQDLHGQFFRSAWEANWARYLNYLVDKGAIGRWQYEPDTFEFPRVGQPTKFYTPDFKIFVGSALTYHEVKGWMNPASIEKLALMQEFNPHVPIEIIEKERYTAVARELGSTIEGWEWNAHHKN